MHCCFRFSGLGSDLLLLPFPPPLPPFLASGGLCSGLGGLAGGEPRPGPLLFGLSTTAQTCGSSFGCSSTTTSALLAFLGFAFTAAAATPGTRNCGVLSQWHFHKSEKFNNLRGTWIHHRHSARLLLLFTILLAATCLLNILTKD